MASHLLAPLIFALLIVRPNWALESPLESELDKDFYKITFNETAMYNHNKAKNIECDVEVKELYRYTDHNFNTPVFEQTIAKAGFYPSIVFINQEIEGNGVSTCLGVILNQLFVLTIKRCLKETSFKTIIRYGAIANNCTGCPITVAKEIIHGDEVSLIHLKYRLRFEREKVDSSDYGQSVGPACDNPNQSNKKFNHKTLLIHVAHGLNANKIDYIYHKPTKIAQRSKELINFPYTEKEVTSESFLFKNENEKLYLIGVCGLRKYDHYYCFNINKHKAFINETVNSLKSDNRTDHKFTNNHWDEGNQVYRLQVRKKCN